MAAAAAAVQELKHSYFNFLHSSPYLSQYCSCHTAHHHNSEDIKAWIMISVLYFLSAMSCFSSSYENCEQERQEKCVCVGCVFSDPFTSSWRKLRPSYCVCSINSLGHQPPNSLCVCACVCVLVCISVPVYTCCLSFSVYMTGYV